MTAPPAPGTRRPRPPVRLVQRPTSDLPIVHLEREPPAPGRWVVEVGGLVEIASAWDLSEILAMPSEERTWDLHCVWGWTRPACRWRGVPAAALIDAARPRPEARFAVAATVEGPYASCLTLDEARNSFLAWEVDGEPLTPDHGGPLRLVQPPGKWGYKGVKWIGSLTLTEHFSPGFWEELVGNPHGDIPHERLDLGFE